MIPLLIALVAIPVWSAALDETIRSAMTRWHVPGAVVVVVNQDETVVMKGYGVADVEGGLPATADSVFALQSTTKLFTGLVALELAAKRTVDLDADVNRYLHSFKVPDYEGQPITLRQLLTHSGGFDERGIGIAARSPDALLPLADYLRRDLPARVRPPGTVSSYSNHGFALAGLVLQEAAGAPFDRLVEELITAPLGLASTTVAQPMPAALSRRAVPGYMWRGRLERVAAILFNDQPSSALHSTAQDMSVFMKAMLNGSRPAWRAALVPEFRHHPRFQGVAIGGAIEQRLAAAAVRHGGDWQDHFNAVLLVPDQRLGIFVASNNGEADAFGQEVIDLILRASSLPPASPEPPAPANVAHDWAGLAGSYRTTRHSRRGLEKIGLLTGAVPEFQVQVNNDLTLNNRPLQQVGNDLYRTAVGDLVTFRRDSSGAVTHLFRAALPTMAFERVGLIRSVATQRVLLMAFVVVFVGRTTWLAFKRRRLNLADVAVVTQVVFALGLIALTITLSPWEFQYGIPVTVRAWLFLPWLAVAFAAAALIRTRRLVWSSAVFLFALLLWEWNLMASWRF